MEPCLTRKAQQRKHQRQQRRRVVRAWRDAVFLWTYHNLEETLHSMQSGPSVILRLRRRKPEPTLREPELLSELLEGRGTHKFLYSSDIATHVRLVVNKSKHLCESLFAWFLREHMSLFVKIRSHKRFQKHPNHRDRQIRFLALRIAAKMSGCSISAGKRLLQRKGECCIDCGRPARLDVGICLHRNPKIGIRGECPECGACTHPFSKPQDHHCGKCGAELLPLMVVAPGITIARPWCPQCTTPQSSAGERTCRNCGTEFETFPVRPHSPRDCRNSSWPCPTHSRVLPEYRHGSIRPDEIPPQASCGVVCLSKT